MLGRKGLCGLAGLFVVAVAMTTTPAGAQVIYPYGYPYAAPGPAYVYPPGYYPPAVVVAPPAVAAPVQPRPQVWYYCDDPKGYYPSVQSCTTTWREVPAQVH
jgi:hypothetical protein